jgi:hypothetical protein
MKTFKSWLKNEVKGIYPTYDGLAVYPSIKAKTNPPKNIKENNERVDFISFSKSGQIRVLVNGTQYTFVVDGLYVDKFRESSYKNPIETFNKLKNWAEKGLAQEI